MTLNTTVWSLSIQFCIFHVHRKNLCFEFYYLNNNINNEIIQLFLNIIIQLQILTKFTIWSE